MAEISLSEWDNFLAEHPNSHLLQTSSWGQLKSEFGWQILRIATQDCGAQLMFKQIFPGINFAYIPKGPVGTNWHSLWPEIDIICHQKRCIFLKVEPDIWQTDDSVSGVTSVQIPQDFIHSDHPIQPLRTLIIDITGDEIQILNLMKQKTRYNINLARKKNVVIKTYTDLEPFYHMMEVTSHRDQFSIHSLAYYQRAFDLFHARDQCQLFVAEFEATPISALMAFSNGDRAWYFYGASSNLHRDKMPNYLLQWEAIRWAKSLGCAQYDLWGVPDVDLDTLEANFTKKASGLWGVYRFKRGFGGDLKRSAGPWDKVYNRFMYRLYKLILKYRRANG